MQRPPSIAIVTDAWHPQTNGVVRTLSTTCDMLRAWGHEVTVISPEGYPSMPAPTYPEIRLALTAPGAVGRRLAKIAPDAVHIATEGPLGFAARRYCLSRKVPFTTAYHTQFPDYLARRTGLPASIFWPYIRWFHRPAESHHGRDRDDPGAIAANISYHHRRWIVDLLIVIVPYESHQVFLYNCYTDELRTCSPQFDIPD